MFISSQRMVPLCSLEPSGARRFLLSVILTCCSRLFLEVDVFGVIGSSSFSLTTVMGVAKLSCAWPTMSFYEAGLSSEKASMALTDTCLKVPFSPRVMNQWRTSSKASCRPCSWARLTDWQDYL